jgi:hypothetical protein
VSKSHLSPLGCAYLALVGLTLYFLWLTVLLFQDWRIATAGVWSTGTVVAVTPCSNRHGTPLGTVHLAVQFVDPHGTRHLSQTVCEDNHYAVGQPLAVRYLLSDPGHILIHADLSGWQGFPLLAILLVDALCIVVSVLGGIYGVRAARPEAVIAVVVRRLLRGS